MRPFISIIIPHGPGGDIDYVLDSLRQVDYPRERMEVLAVEGVLPSLQRNMAAEKARGKVLFFFDDDVKVEKETLDRLLSHYEKNVACVGGPNLTPKDDRLIQKAFGYAMGSPFGAAKMSVRYKAVGEAREASETDLILCNLSVDREIFLKSGGFPHDFYPNEENVFFNRLREKDYTLLYDPQAIVYHRRRGNLRKTMKQIFSYGRGRFQQTSVQPTSFSFMFLIPTVFVLYLASLLFFRPPAYLYFLLAYLLLDALFTLFVSIKEGDYLHLLVLPWMYPLIHISYGLGFIYGFLKFLLRRKAKIGVDINTIKVRKVKLE